MQLMTGVPRRCMPFQGDQDGVGGGYEGEG